MGSGLYRLLFPVGLGVARRFARWALVFWRFGVDAGEEIVIPLETFSPDEDPNSSPDIRKIPFAFRFLDDTWVDGLAAAVSFSMMVVNDRKETGKCAVVVAAR